MKKKKEIRKIVKIKIADIKIPEEYCRMNIDLDTVEVYEEILDKLPPIVVNKNMLLIDGHHTLWAEKEKGTIEVDAEVLDIPDDKVFEESIRRNVKHGKNLTKEDRKKSAVILCQKGVDLNQIAELLAISYSSVVKYTEDLRSKEQRERDATIIEMVNEGKTQEEVAKVFGLDRSRIGQIVNTASYNNFMKTSDGIGTDDTDAIFGPYDNPEELKEKESPPTQQIGGSVVCTHCGKKFNLIEERTGSSTKHRIELS